MKKKIAAIVLSLTMCVGTAVPASALDFSDGSGIAWEAAYEAQDITGPGVQEPVQTETELQDNGQTGTDQEAGADLQGTVPDGGDAAESFGSGETEPGEMVPGETGNEEAGNGEADPGTQDPVTEEPADPFTDAADGEDLLFSSEEKPEEKTDAASITADGTVMAGEKDWVSTENGFMLLKEAGETPVYFTEADGILKIETTSQAGIVHSGYYVFDENGILVTGVRVLKGDEEAGSFHYFVEPEDAQLYEECLEQPVTPATSDLGQMIYESWLWDGEAFTYFGSDGACVPVESLETYDGTWGYVQIEDAYYRLDANGVPFVGTAVIDGIPYNFLPAQEGVAPGRMQTGWVTIDGILRYVDPVTGVCLKGFQTIDGKRYYFWYGNGAVRTGWADIGNDTYYFDPATGAAATGLVTVGNTLYGFDAQTGARLKGWQEIDGKRYYFWYGTGSPRTGLMESGDDLFYLDPPTGAMAEGWRVIGGNKYYFHPETGKAVNGWQEIDGGRYYFWYGNKVMRTGFMNTGDDIYYLDFEKGVVKGWADIGSYRYYFHPETGKAVKGWQEIDGKRYYFWYATGALRTGFMNADGNIYYIDRYAGMLKGKQKIGSDVYHFDETTGAAKKGWEVTDGKYSYYWYNTGARAKGWCTIGGQRYYFWYNEGYRATGWCSIGGQRYYFWYNTGVLRTGWMDTADGRYYLKPSDGALVRNQMIKAGSEWYYAQADGRLLKDGWKYLNNHWYCFSDYKAKRNAFGKHNGTGGYFNGSGEFCTGWYVVNDSKNLVKYVNSSGTDWYRNTSVVIDGYQYYFDKDGYRMQDVTHIYKGPYYVEVDTVNCVMTVFNSGGNIPVKSIRISPGMSGTPTPTGRFRLSRAGRWQALMGPSWGQYGTHVVGAGAGGIFVHSIPGTDYAGPSLYDVDGRYDILGHPASHGCIRCCVADAKWIWDNCNGATVRIFRGTYQSKEVFKGPLGRRPLVPRTGNFDPTDPAV